MSGTSTSVTITGLNYPSVYAAAKLLASPGVKVGPGFTLTGTTPAEVRTANAFLASLPATARGTFINGPIAAVTTAVRAYGGNALVAHTVLTRIFYRVVGR